MRVRRAHNREGRNFRPCRTPQIGVGVWPSPGSAVLQLVVVWQAKKAVAEKKNAAEEAEKVRSSPALDGFGLRRTARRHVRMRGVATSFSFTHERAVYDPRRAMARARA